MSSVRYAAAALLAALALVAQAAEPTVPAAGQLLGSCRVGALSCTDFDRAVGAGAKAACLKYKLDWAEAACPVAKAVGTCVKSEGGGRSYTHSYPPLDGRHREEGLLEHAGRTVPPLTAERPSAGTPGQSQPPKKKPKPLPWIGVRPLPE